MRVPRNLSALVALACVSAGCATYHPPEVKLYSFPQGDAFLDQPKRLYETLGQVRTRVDYVTLNPDWDESRLCQNYYNKAVRDLVSRAKDKGGDAVIGVRSVVYLVDGKHQTYRTPECADDGQNGQILAEGIAIRWVRKPKHNERPLATQPHRPVSPTDPLF